MLLIMVIELSGVQFGLKSYEWFQNRKFDLKSPELFQPKIARHEVQLPLYYSHFEIAEFYQYQYFIDQVASLLKRYLHLILYSKQNWCDIEQNGYDLEQKWCDLEHK